MANPHQKKFDNPSRLFIWLFSFGNFFRNRSFYNKLLEEIDFQGNESVLEFGSGVGTLAKKIAPKIKNGGSLSCIDVSEKLIQHTKKKLKKFSNIQFYEGNIIDQAIPAECYDVIVSTWVLHHVHKGLLPETIKKFNEVLKKDGNVFIIEFPDSRIDHTNLSQKDLLELFERENFSSSIIFTKKQGILYKFQKKYD